MAEKYTDETRKTETRTGAEGGAEVYHDPKKAGLPWWLWPLLALLLLGLILFALNRHNAPVAETPVTQQAAPAPAPATDAAPAATPAPAVDASGGATTPAGQDIKIHKGTDIATARPGQASVPGVPLSDVVTFASAADPMALVGRKAKFVNVPIRKVITDRAFFVGPSDTQQMLVLLDKGITTGPDAPKVSIQTGSPISLTGIVAALPTQEAINQTYGVSGADYASLQSQKAYLHATVLQVK